MSGGSANDEDEGVVDVTSKHGSAAKPRPANVAQSAATQPLNVPFYVKVEGSGWEGDLENLREHRVR